MVFPAVTKSWPPDRQTAECSYSYLKWPQTIATTGKTTMILNSLGKSNRVFCTEKSKYKPGLVKLTDFRAIETTANCQPEHYMFYNGLSAYPMRVTLDGPILAMFGYLVPDLSLAGLPSAWDQSLADQVLQNAYAKCNEPAQNVGVMAAELRETLHFLKSPLGSLVTYCQKWYRHSITKKPVRYGRMRKRDAVSSLSDTWMSYRYGLRPMLKDVSDIMKGTRQRTSALLAERAGVSRTDTTDGGVGWVTVLGMKFLLKFTQTVTTKASAVCLYRENQNISDLEYSIDALGLDIWSAPSIAYEMIPLSFVLDWFWNVGTWLKAFQPNFRVMPQGHSVTCTKVVQDDIVCIKASTVYGDYGMQVPCPVYPYTMQKRIVDRRPNPIVSLLPSFVLKEFKFQRDMDALSLIWQRLPSVFR